jgi:hypothetical protein
LKDPGIDVTFIEVIGKVVSGTEVKMQGCIKMGSDLGATFFGFPPAFGINQSCCPPRR